ncbi:MAG TPA: aspartate 1-decarboxylase [Candidatus Limnocylindria bacterium]|jgi:aspartate 1-decarboxylase|nr:aspartate 1-decarboxylase [Candidatus Limnocylindria bacterium]HTL66660.1 aspartate 1-decarboxylase [Lacunisphaera sp.]
MLLTFLKSKLHRATVTSADLNYEGSISLDRTLCREADLREFEQVDVYDITNGARFTTYVIYGQPGQVQLNGAAARLVQLGDRIIVAAYVGLQPEEVAGHAPKVVLLGERNVITSVHQEAVTPP